MSNIDASKVLMNGIKLTDYLRGVSQLLDEYRQLQQSFIIADTTLSETNIYSGQNADLTSSAPAEVFTNKLLTLGTDGILRVNNLKTAIRFIIVEYSLNFVHTSVAAGDTRQISVTPYYTTPENIEFTAFNTRAVQDTAEYSASGTNVFHHLDGMCLLPLTAGQDKFKFVASSSAPSTAPTILSANRHSFMRITPVWASME